MSFSKGRPEMEGTAIRDGARRRYQGKVQALLDAIDERRQRKLALVAGGVTRSGMSELVEELRALRSELAAVVAAGSEAFASEPGRYQRAVRPLIPAAA
jgi:hypothetical protein